MNEFGTAGNAGKFYWTDGDTEEQYRHNLTTKSHELEKNGWLDAEESIVYDIGSYLFRERRIENPQKTQYLAIGCSYTFGLGLPIEHTWPYMLEQKFDKKVYNLGAPGMGNETFFRLAYHWIPILKPEIVMVLAPGMDRRERITYHGHIHLEESWKPLGSWCTPDNEIDMAYMNKTECFYSNMRAILGIQALCHLHGARFLYFNHQKMSVLDKDKARDLVHPGKAYMKQIADTYYTRIRKKQWFDMNDIL